LLSNIFFDLRRYIEQFPKKGFVNIGIYYAARRNWDTRCRKDLMSTIASGRPLRISFRRLLNSSDEALIERAVAIYRERFSTIGLI